LYNKVFKNYQVNVGIPFQVRNPLNFQTIKQIAAETEQESEEASTGTGVSAEEILEKAREDAALIIKEAQFEVIRLMENAEQEIHQNSIQVEAEARNKGYEEGLNESRKQYEDLIREAEFIKENAKIEYKEVLAGIEADVVETILDVARKVIGTEIIFNKEDILYLVKQAFEKCANKDNVVLKVSADDYEFLVNNRDRLHSMIEGLGEIEIKKDSSMKAGSCILETRFGSIDAGVDTRLKRIEEAFRQLIGK